MLRWLGGSCVARKCKKWAERENNSAISDAAAGLILQYPDFLQALKNIIAGQQLVNFIAKPLSGTRCFVARRYVAMQQLLRGALSRVVGSANVAAEQVPQTA